MENIDTQELYRIANQLDTSDLDQALEWCNIMKEIARRKK